MRILIIGSGAREHAIARALDRDPSVTELHVAPGNAGTAQLAINHKVSASNPTDVLRLARLIRPNLVVVGPEVPLVEGVADVLRDAGFTTFGPSSAAAKIEGSKRFAKDIMAAASVPTGRSATVNDFSGIDAALEDMGSPYVVKDDGLAAGKGVVVTKNKRIAIDHAWSVLSAGHPVLVEEYLAGPEVSLFAICDGTRAVPLVAAQDFKRVGDSDSGPNTGGMGAYAPLPWAPANLTERVQREILDPVLVEMRRRGTPFTGLLYAGLAITADGPKVIEFNCRFGDPETQVVLELLDTPLSQLLWASAAGDLSTLPPLMWRPGSAVTVVIAAENYPDKPVIGDIISGANAGGVLHAGTARDESGNLVSSGGRVLSCTAFGETLASARDAAYALVDEVHLRGSHHRTDIASAAIAGSIYIP
ncbi:MAG: phosphoribosylamine--glycine ligase [Nakamurella sp.]